MSKLDQALEACLQDATEQDAYYQLVLASDFYVPLQVDENTDSEQDPESVQPLILESEGKPYVMLFDSEERLNEWSSEPVHYAVLAGHLVAELSPPELHWAVNLGSGFAKEFVPEEISYLKELASTR